MIIQGGRCVTQRYKGYKPINSEGDEPDEHAAKCRCRRKANASTCKEIAKTGEEMESHRRIRWQKVMSDVLYCIMDF